MRVQATYLLGNIEDEHFLWRAGRDLNPDQRGDFTCVSLFCYIACEETITGSIKSTDMTEEDLKAITQTIVGVKVSAEINDPICWK